MQKKVRYSLFAFLLVLAACKKDDDISDPYGYISPTNDRTEQTLDSIYMYAREIWLWNTALPSYEAFNPRSYQTGSGIDAYQRCLFDLLQYAHRGSDGRPYEQPVATNRLKYSYLELADNGTPEALAVVSLQGVGDDYGFEVGQYASNDVRLLYVNPGSPAHIAGFRRGDRILRINGVQITTTGMVRALLDQAEIRLQTVDSDGKARSAALRKTAYTSNGIYKSKIIETDGQKIGYLAYARFADVAGLEQELEAVFETFAAQTVQTLVVDLRYNLGGYVKGVETMANFMAPPSLNGKTMYAEHFNLTLQQGKATILKNQPYDDNEGKPVLINGRRATYHDVDYSIAGNTKVFEKSGNLSSLKKIYFIVSGNTASAAEMLMQVFKPYIDVKVVGSTTYGKPVGFFGINIDRYKVYYSSFHIRNASGEGDYYDGIIPGIPAADDIRYDFGDVREASLATVLHDIDGTAPSSKAMTLPETIQAEETGYRVSGFRGLLEHRIPLNTDLD